MVEKGKVPNFVRLEQENSQDKTEPLPFDDLLGDGLGLPYQQEPFMTGKELRDIGERRVLDAYITSRTLTDQIYVPRKRKIVKSAMKWKVPASKPEEFKFSADTNQSKHPWETQTGGSVFKFGNTKARETPEEPKPYSAGHNFVFGKAQVETKKSQGPDCMSHTTMKRKKNFPKPRKINPYFLRDQELKIEERKRAQRIFFNWKRRKQQKLERNTTVLNVSKLLQKNFLKKSKNKKRRINTQEQVTAKVTKKPIGITYMLEKEGLCIFCLEKRQQSSPAVMFARLRSNRRYKPGD